MRCTTAGLYCGYVAASVASIFDGRHRVAIIGRLDLEDHVRFAAHPQTKRRVAPLTVLWGCAWTVKSKSDCLAHLHRRRQLHSRTLSAENSITNLDDKWMAAFSRKMNLQLENGRY
jgi:hypothetical protein